MVGMCLALRLPTPSSLRDDEHGFLGLKFFFRDTRSVGDFALEMYLLYIVKLAKFPNDIGFITDKTLHIHETCLTVCTC